MSAKSLGAAAVEAYEDLRPKYQSLAETVRNILSHAIPEDCGIHSIQARGKDVDSFRLTQGNSLNTARALKLFSLPTTCDIARGGLGL